jgi:hypothetical protein
VKLNWDKKIEKKKKKREGTYNSKASAFTPLVCLGNRSNILLYLCSISLNDPSIEIKIIYINLETKCHASLTQTRNPICKNVGWWEKFTTDSYF